MDSVIAMCLFAAAVLTCLVRGCTLVYGLLAGFAGFAAMALHRGCTVKALARACLEGVRESLLVVRILCIIGVLTAMWRMNGTIAFCTYYGVLAIPPRWFVVCAFALSAIVSYAIGTSLGVAGTIGIILMGIARSGGVNEYVAAGAILSGVYFGDRCSPMGSAANLVASLTQTELYGNVRRMLQTSVLPVAVCLAVYGVCSTFFPMQTRETALLDEIAQEFSMTPWLLAPMVIMLALPMLRVNTCISAAASALCAGLEAALIQHEQVLDILHDALLGFSMESRTLGSIFSGGGLISMFNVACILLISGTFPKILQLTGCLAQIQAKIEKSYSRCSRFALTALLSLPLVAVFCSQIIAAMMLNTLIEEPYRHAGASKQELALDISNSVITMAPYAPWSLAIAVPMELMQVGPRVIFYIVIIFAVPLCYLLTKRLIFPEHARAR